MKEQSTAIGQLYRVAHGLRKDIITMCHRAGSGHPGGSLSACEILSVLYYRVLNVDPEHPKDPNRDRFVLSKGHAAPALYAILARKGYFDKAELLTLRQINSRLQGHPDMTKVPGVEISSGSLGMGISFGIGTALASRLSNRSYRTYVMTGCGELDEGQNWEALLTAAKYNLEELCVIVDFNKIQLDGRTDDILPLGNLQDKFVAFGWNAIECDGHDIEALLGAFSKVKNSKGKPSVIIAHTVKGKGISFMEDKHTWHGRSISDVEYNLAMAELSGA